jgi:DNA polymerase III delta prime subunit
MREFYEFFHNFFTIENLSVAQWEDIQKIGDHIHAMNQLALAKKRAFGNPNYSIEQYRETFLHLISSDESVEERIRWFLTSEDSASKYLGGGAISEIMAQLNAERYIMWNRRDQEASEYLGLDPNPPRGLDTAASFERANAIVRSIFPIYEEIVGKQTELPIGIEVDQFLSWIYETRLSQSKKPHPPADIQHAWVYSPGNNASHLEMLQLDGDMGINWQIGNLATYNKQEDVLRALQQTYPKAGNNRPTNDARSCYDFGHSIQEGHLVFAKKGRREIVAWGIVTGPYRYEPQKDFCHRRKIEWKATGHWELPAGVMLSVKTLTDITNDVEQVQMLVNLVQDDRKISPSNTLIPPQPNPLQRYDLDKACEDVFIPRETIADIRDRLTRKLNIILQGPPGVGKTYVARRLAWLLMEEQDDSRIGLVQFHQSMGYEDFVQGYRPQMNGQGFRRKNGVFIDFCQRASQDPGRKWVFIIDEINRGNMSKILGELLMLIEHDKRSKRYATRLALHEESDTPFFVPPNVHIIGLMNTADRSLAVVDHALRRRFSFIDIEPAFGQYELQQWLMRYWEDDVAQAIDVRLCELNRAIEADPDLGCGYRIGHSHFCDQKPDIKQNWNDYQILIKSDIAPLLREYWFDRPNDAFSRIEVLLDGIEE